MRRDLYLVTILIATLSLIVVPIHQSVIDGLLALNLSLSVVLLIVAIYLKQPSDFSTFPSVILIGTAFRLALSIGTTRLILSEADAGSIIETFGNFVVAGSIMIGLVIFLIITAVQFLVITKGAERVAEVGARFTLDALPGKQMTIDAMVKAGDIEPEEGSRLRAQLDKNSQFFGAMDGAMKFIKGDAIAGIVIICINLIGGIAVGMNVHGLSFSDAAATFSLLTIGDGLVAQIPALLMAMSAGIIVTRVTDSENIDLGSDISRELFSDHRVPAMSGAIILLLGLIPGFPLAIFSSFSVVLLTMALYMRRRAAKEEKPLEESREEISEDVEGRPEENNEPLRELPQSNRFQVLLGSEITSGLNIDLLNESLLDLFWTLFSTRGVQFPIPKLVPNAAVAGNTWVLQLDEVPIQKGTLDTADILVGTSDRQLLEDSLNLSELQSAPEEVLTGIWVPRRHSQQIESMGLSYMEPEAVLSLIAFRKFEQNLGTLFTLDDFYTYQKSLRAADPETMSVIEGDILQPQLFKMLSYLVEDGVPLRPLELVISSLHYWIHTLDSPTPIMLAECLRGSLRRQLCYRLAGKVGAIGMVIVSPELEKRARRAIQQDADQFSELSSKSLVFDAETTEAVIPQLKDIASGSKDGAAQPTVMVAADLRRRMRNFLAENNIHLPVLAPHELANEVPSFPIGIIEAEIPVERLINT
ncbi:hypothetical protein FEE96_22930 [Parasedimentitalea maritima]|uniref:EscV/YscV/HrcV family type III secretion system export apparatus protein n=1 Tax=Parasedimentitalea maritima TaxID=2578117 RepID=A0ABY2UNE5_9RHOB|nr:flagellar biosynthesis protein FlhA [Zongyanglinia marina]TLP55331.1 hypothetical protein FEE96_22930 [Zongyanglinia marina]